MIAAKDNAPHLTPEEYFTWEEQQLEKHELIDGQVYAITGGSVNHSRIAIRFATMVDTHLDASSCITGNSDLRVNIVGTNNYTYPDISVTCDDRDKTTTQYITYPCLIIEVLSKTTEAYDRGGKFSWTQERIEAIQQLCIEENLKVEVVNQMIADYKFSGKEPLRETVLSACNEKPKLLDRKKIFARVVSKLLDIINKFDDALGELGEEE
jgi:Uma2 family endonuclease